MISNNISKIEISIFVVVVGLLIPINGNTIYLVAWIILDLPFFLILIPSPSSDSFTSKMYLKFIYLSLPPLSSTYYRLL